MRKKILLLIGLLLTLQSVAQQTRGRYFFEDENPLVFWEKKQFLPKGKATILAELAVSGASYQGDMGIAFQRWTSVFDVGIRFNRRNKLNGKITIAWGKVQQQNESFGLRTAFNQNENEFFQTDFFKFQYEWHWHLIKTKHWGAYLGQGIGGLQFTVRNQQGENLQELRSTRAPNEDFENFTLILPTSVGFYYLFANSYGIGVQALLLNPRTDYLDNISKLGQRAGNDQVLQLRFHILIPLQRKVGMNLPSMPVFDSR